MICYVSGFLDLKREKWSHFSRSFDKYFAAFKLLADLFKTKSESCLVVFIDKIHYATVFEYTKNIERITLVQIDRDWLHENSPLWQRLNREREIMQSASHIELIKHRFKCPETHNPEYTLINHCKIDLIFEAMKKVNYEYYAWVDFGYFSSSENWSGKLLDSNKLSLTTINYSLINLIDDMDKNIIYTLVEAPEKIGGFFFFGRKDKLIEYRKLYHKVHKTLQDINIVDDDQCMALQCYFKNPSLFTLHMNKKSEKSVMTKQGIVKVPVGMYHTVFFDFV